MQPKPAKSQVELAIRKLEVPEVDGVTYEEVIEAGEHLPGMAALWDVATPQERREMVVLILQPEGLYYDTELKIIAAIKPQPTFLPVLRMLQGFVEYEETSALLVTEHWSYRNRRATASLSPVLTLYLAPAGKLYLWLRQCLEQEQTSTSIIAQEKKPTNIIPLPVTTPRHPGPKKPRQGIPRAEWPTIRRRVLENQEPLRRVAQDYDVSHETVRRVVRAARNPRRQEHGS